ncbi:MAG: hypothetical protein KDB10_00110, partial [Acidimicrobiales bacterium]|nr:hypothetical protein [Acidimicrobiales bacterium]
LPTSAWALVDGAGNSQVGFWPLHIGEERFVLSVVGIPRLHQQAFTDLIWVLMLRYGAPATPSTPAATDTRPSDLLQGAHP